MIQIGPKWKGLKHSVTLGVGDLRAEKQKALMDKGGTRTLGKPAVLIGAPLNNKRVWRNQSDHTQRSTRDSGGERKTVVIARYRLSKSTELDVHMALDLEEPRSDD